MNARTIAQQQNTAIQTFTPLKGDVLQRKCACGQHTIASGECVECRKKRINLQRRATNQAEPITVPPIVRDVLRSPGRPLDLATRAIIEPRFGHDFSRVRVHTDAKANESARAVNALAYTLGRDIVFGARQYAPGTDAGRQLLVHELTHVVQQGAHSFASSDLFIKTGRNRYEAEARQVAKQVPSQRPLQADGCPPRSNISHDPEPAIRRWKIDGNTATAEQESDYLGRLAVQAGARFRDWKCIRPISMRTFRSGSASESRKDNYERFVQIGDTFDISNLKATTGPSLSIYLFDDGSQTMDANLVKLFYPGSKSSLDADVDIEGAAEFGKKPVKDFLIFGHSGGNAMWGNASRFEPANFKSEEPKVSFSLAEAGMFPRRCWFTRNATARSVGCNSQAFGNAFATSYLRKGATVVTTTSSVGPWCSPAAFNQSTNTCNFYDGLRFASSPAPSATTLEGPFFATADFHNGSYWSTIMGKL